MPYLSGRCRCPSMSGRMPEPWLDVLVVSLSKDLSVTVPAVAECMADSVDVSWLSIGSACLTVAVASDLFSQNFKEKKLKSVVGT